MKQKVLVGVNPDFSRPRSGLVKFGIIVIVLAQFFSLPVFSEEEKETVIKVPRYTILKNAVIDTPFKTLVEMDILIPESTTEKGIRWLLNKLYFSIMRKGTYKYHIQPTNVYIYVYSAYDRYTLDKSLRMAALKKNPDDVEPTVEINPLQVPVEEPPDEAEKKFGLVEEKRKAIWKELVMLEDRVFNMAEEKYVPLPTNEYLPSTAISRLEQEVDFQRSILSLELEKLAEKYGLTREQLDEIMTEGIEKNWPYPKD